MALPKSVWQTGIGSQILRFYLVWSQKIFAEFSKEFAGYGEHLSNSFTVQSKCGPGTQDLINARSSPHKDHSHITIRGGTWINLTALIEQPNEILVISGDYEPANGPLPVEKIKERILL